MATNMNNPTPKKGFAGLTLHMTGGRWLMVGVGGIAFLTAIGIIWVESHGANTDAGANVGMSSHQNIQNTPGKSSPEYAAQVEAYNKKKAAEALKQNKSFIGVPVTSTYSTVLNNPPAQKEKTAYHPSYQDTTNNPPKQPPPPKPVSQLGDNSIKSEFAVIAASMKSYRAVNNGYYIPEAVDAPIDSGNGNDYLGNMGETKNVTSDNQKKLPYIIPGTMLYGVFDNTMKSSLNVRTVIGTLVDGKYNGDRVIGSFEKPSNTNALTVHFNTLVFPDGKTVNIDAYAVSPKTTLPAMETSVNYHVLSRSASFLGAAFMAGIEGYGQSLAQQGSTSVSSALGGVTQTYPALTTAQTLGVAVGQAAEQLQPVQSALANNIMEPDTVTLVQGTPFGLLVVSSGSVKAAEAVNAVDNQQKTQDSTVKKQSLAIH